MPARRNRTPAEKTLEQVRLERLEEACRVVERTPEEKVRFELASRLSYTDSRLAHFKEMFDGGDHHNAFEWSQDAFEAAAERRVIKCGLEYFNRGFSLNLVLKEFEDYVDHVNRGHTGRSTSPAHNIADECERVALNTILHELKRIARLHADAVAMLYCDQEESAAAVDARS